MTLQVGDKVKSRTFVMDDKQAELKGKWMHSISMKGYHGTGYIHDKNEHKGQKSVRYVPPFPESGDYLVIMNYPAGYNRASNTSLVVTHATGSDTFIVNQKGPKNTFAKFKVGRFRFEKEQDAHLEIKNKGTDGYVVIDAFLFVFLDQD